MLLLGLQAHLTLLKITWPSSKLLVKNPRQIYLTEDLILGFLLPRRKRGFARVGLLDLVRKPTVDLNDGVRWDLTLWLS